MLKPWLEASQGQSDEKRIRILVVDDEPIIRNAMKHFFHRFPFLEMVGEAEDAGEAIERARSLQPDLILMDYMMPYVDGLQAAGMIRDQGLRARIILFTTYLFELDEKSEALKRVDYIINKQSFRMTLMPAIQEMFFGVSIPDPTRSEQDPGEAGSSLSN